MQIVAAARAVDVEEFSGQIQAAIQARAHRLGIDFVKGDAARGHLCVLESLRAGNGQGECGHGVCKRSLCFGRQACGSRFGSYVGLTQNRLRQYPRENAGKKGLHIRAGQQADARVKPGGGVLNFRQL